MAPPGWYPDGDGWERRWDGQAWTEERRPVPPVQAPPAEASPMDDVEATVVRRGPLGNDGATIISAKPPLPPTPAPDEAIWPEEPAASSPEPAQAIWPADPAGPAGSAPAPDQAVWPADPETPQQGPHGTNKPGHAPDPSAGQPPAFAPAAATQVGLPGGSPSGPPAPHAPPNAAAAPPPAWSPAPPPPPAQAWSPGPPAGGPVGAQSGGSGGPSYPYPQQGGFGGPPPPARKKSLAWLWVVIAVVLVVLAGAAVTLVVTKPWDDSSDTAGGNEGGDDGGEGGEGGEQDTPDPVTSDIDGDGRGDAVARLTNDSKSFRVTLTSSGTALDVEEETIPGEEELVWGDFNGDGTLEMLTWTYEGSTFELSGESFAGASTALGTWKDTQQVAARVGDYDGDGFDDVAVQGQVDKDSVTVWVMRSNGEGFDAAAEWLTLDNTTFAATVLYEGDWDADGLDDLLALVPNETLRKKDYASGYFDGDMGVALMKSDGSAFQPGSISAVDAEVYQDDYVVGDFTGEGKPMIAVDNGFTSEIDVYEFDGTDLVLKSAFGVKYQSGGTKGSIEAFGVSDLDGDRKDDLVFVTYDFGTEQYEGFLVARSTGAAFGQVETWAETPECKDFCYMEFQQGS